MKTRTRLVISGLRFGMRLIFGSSATTKLVDFENTVIYFQSVSGLCGSEPLEGCWCCLFFSKCLSLLDCP